MSATLFPTRALILFVALSGADLTLTWQLLRDNAGAVYESNPLASWWLKSCGWLGLASFKVATVALTAWLAILIFLRHPRAGQWVLIFGSACLAIVVVYSALLFGAMRFGLIENDPEASSRVDEAWMKNALQRNRVYLEVKYAVLRDLRAGRCSLARGVDRLAATEQARDPIWQAGLQHRYPGYSLSDCITALLSTYLAEEAIDSPLDHP